MANELTPTSVADLFASEVVSAEFLYTLASRDASILMHPAIVSVTALAGSNAGSNVIKVPHRGDGGNLMTAIAQDGSAHANTAYASDSTSVTLVPKAVNRAVTDFARYLAPLGAQDFAKDLVWAYQQSLIADIANVTDGFAQSVGTTAVNLTWEDIIEAKTLLSLANAEGPMICILHPRQWGDLEVDLLSQDNIVRSAGLGAFDTKTGSYKGQYLGIDFFTTPHVPTANAGDDRAGALFSTNGVVVAHALVSADEADADIMVMGNVILERCRDGVGSKTNYMLRATYGVSIGVEAGVTIISDA